MKRSYALALIFTMLLPAFSVAFSTTPICAQESEKATWTIMIYLDADNNLDPYGVLNLQQIQKGFDQSANVNVVVLLDRLYDAAYFYDIKNNTNNRCLGEIDMGSWETLKDFVVNVTRDYPSEYYMLIIWDHGLGWPGVCWDDTNSTPTYRSHMSPYNISRALSDACQEGGKRVNIVGFDACLMGMIEVCYELKDVTDIVIGSEMLIPGYGWPYKELMQYISENPDVDPHVLSEFIVNEYVAYYSRISPNFFVQLSAINMSKIDDMVVNLTKLTEHLSQNTNAYKGLITGARSASQQKFMLGTVGVLFYSDLYKFADLIQKRTTDPKLIELSFNLMNSIDEMVFAENHTRPQGNLDQKQYGLTVYFPPNRQTVSYRYFDYVSDFKETGWFDFLLSFYGLPIN